MLFKVPTNDMGTEANPEVLHIIARIQTPGENELDETKDEVVTREDKISEYPLQLLAIDKNKKGM
jgi:hypothetical protein